MASRLIESPCIRKCSMALGRCSGCGRTREHLAKWIGYSDKERKQIMNELKNIREDKIEAI